VSTHIERLSLLLVKEVLDHVVQGGKFHHVNHPELEREVVEVLEAGVDVGLGADFLNLVKVVNVHMAEHPGQALEDISTNVLKVLGELLSWKRQRAEDEKWSGQEKD